MFLISGFQMSSGGKNVHTSIRIFHFISTSRSWHVDIHSEIDLRFREFIVNDGFTLEKGNIYMRHLIRMRSQLSYMQGFGNSSCPMSCHFFLTFQLGTAIDLHAERAFYLTKNIRIHCCATNPYVLFKLFIKYSVQEISRGEYYSRVLCFLVRTQAIVSSL